MKLLVILFAFLCGHSLAGAARAADQPNVLFIMADDLRVFGGASTRAVVKTPNLDRFAARGVRFERAFAQYPVCNPSLVSMLTGLRCEQTGVVDNTTRFDRSCRAPLLIAAPGVKGGQVCRAPVEFLDLYPTVAELCGVTAPHALAGKSLRPVLADATRAHKDAAFTLVTRGPQRFGQSARTARWRFTQWSDGTSELYDHDADSEETRNVAHDPAHAAVVTEMKRRLQTLPAWPPDPEKRSASAPPRA